MAGDRRLFQEALKRGSDHAWNGRWERAVEEYRVALEQFPEDVSARTYMAMAAFRAGQLSTALDLYQGLWRAQPSNLATLQRMAELQEATSDRESAATNYRVLAEIYGRRRSFKDAFKAWRKVVELKPGDPILWGSLLDVAAQVGALAEVMPGYLRLARNLALEGRFQEAVQVAERASALDPKNPSVMGLLSAIRRALEYSWRASSLGDETPLDALPHLIPPLEGAPPPPAEVDALPPEPAAPRPEPSETMVIGKEQAEKPSRELAIEATEVRPEIPSVLEPEPSEMPAAKEPPPAFASVEQPPSEAELVEEPPEPAAPEPPMAAEGQAPREVAAPEPPASSVPPEPEVAEASPEPIGEEAPPDLDHHDSEVEAPAGWPEQAPAEASTPESLDHWGGAPAAEAGEPEVGEPVEAMAESGQPGEIAAEAAEPEEPATQPTEELQAAECPEAEDEEEETVTWQDLLQQAQEARTSGRLIEAAAMYQEAIAAGAAMAEQLVALAETYQQLGRREQAATAYEQALALAPRLPSALLGMARFHLSEGQWEAAEEKLSEALDASATAGVADGETLELLLEALKERAALGAWGPVAERLAWIRSGFLPARLPRAAADSLLSACVDLLGQCAGEHLEEVASLPPEERGQAVVALRSAEDRLRRGELRSAADEMYQILASRGDFLPAQSLLGRVLAVQGRVGEAEEKARRLLELYDLRGVPHQALEVLWWMVAHGVGNGESRAQLVQRLREQNRVDEAEMVELGWREPAPPLPELPAPGAVADRGVGAGVPAGPPYGVGAGVPAGPPGSVPGPSGGQRRPPLQESWTPAPTGIRDAGLSPAETGVGPAVPDAAALEEPTRTEAEAVVEEPRTSEVLPQPEGEWPEEARGVGGHQEPVVADPPPLERPQSVADRVDEDLSPRDDVLKLAEASFAAGDRAGALKRLRSALEADWMADDATRAAFVRIIEVLRAGPSGGER